MSEINDKRLEELELKQLINESVTKSIKDLKDELREERNTMFIIKLSKFETAYNIGKFVVVAVLLLVIGTLYQLFISLAKMGNLK